MSTCPGRNYCDPSQSGCGNQNRGATWFYTNQSRTCDDVDTCLPSSNTAQDYCNNHAGDYGGGTFNAYCYVSGTCIGSTESNWTCVRTSWNPNNKLSCCIGNLNDVGSCDPSWCPQNLSGCGDALASFCSQEQNVATNPTCVQYCSVPANKVHCDPAMRQYCVAHPEDPLCTCINATSIPRPSCFDVQCTETGYQTQEMVMDATNCGAFCGEFISCVQSNQCNINDPAFVQQCGNVTPPTPPSGGGGFPAWVWLAIGIALLVVVLLLGIYIVYRSRRRE